MPLYYREKEKGFNLNGIERKSHAARTKITLIFFFFNEDDNFLTLKVFYPTGGKIVLDLIILTDKENSVTELKVRELVRCK